MDESTKGAWLVHHTGKLSRVHAPGDYEATRIAGKAGVLLSTISAEEQSVLTTEQMKLLSKAAGIDPTFELPVILNELESHRLVDVSSSGTEVLGLTNAVILRQTATIFDGRSPESKEQAALELAEVSSHAPIEVADVSEYLADTFQLSASETGETLKDAEELGFVDYEPLDTDRRLYFNGYLFQRDEVTKAKRVLDSLTVYEQSLVREVDERLRKSACVAEESIRAILGEKLFDKLHSIGMYNVNVVSNPTDSVRYITRPAAFAKYGDTTLWDAFDHAKALVASLQYGMERSTPGRGQITFVAALLRRLVAGDWVGPATAIGEDYRVLEVRRVVETEFVGGTRYRMRLLKPEVGRLALSILTQGDASISGLENFPSAGCESRIDQAA